MPIEIFCCYSRKDQSLLEELKSHLIPLQQGGLITLWADTDIGAGTNWEEEIRKHLNTAQIILLLISPDFMNSEYCYSNELQRAMERQELGETKVFPIILRPVFWLDAPFGKLQALPKDAKPITSWQNKDEAFLNVAEGIRTTIKGLTRAERPLVPTKTFPRRTFFGIGLGGIVVIGVGLTWWELAQRSTGSTHSSGATSSSKSTPSRTSVSSTVISTPIFTYTGHRNNISGIAWSPDGRFIASIAYDNTVQVWNPFSDNNVANPQFEGYLSGVGQSVTWSPNGKYIATADVNNFVSIWDWQAPNNNLTYAFDTQHPLRCVSWSPEGNFLGFASINNVAQVLDVSQVKLSSIIKTYPHDDAVNGVAWSSDGKYLATASKDKTVKVWQSPPAGNLINLYPGHKGEVYAVAWYADNICSVSCDTTIQVWNAFTLGTIFHSNFPDPRNCVHSVSWSPDGKSVVASSWNGKVEVWKPPLSTPIFAYSGHKKAVSAVAWSPNGYYVASGSDDHTVQVWHVL